MKSDWTKIQLGNLGKIVTGKTPATKKPEYWEGQIPFVTPKDLQGTKHILQTERYITDAGLESTSSCELPANAVCVSCIGNIGYVGMTSQKCISNQQINCIIPNKYNKTRFIYYLMKNLWPFFKNYEGQSTTLSILNKTQFSKIEVIIPQLTVQKRISGILSALDDKIELNNKINDNLEQQARLTLNWWMVEHSGEYESLPLSDIATVNSNVYSPKEQWHFINYLDTSSITDGTIAELQHIVPTIDKLPSRARRKIIANDVVFSTVRPNQHHFGIIKQPVPNMLASTGFAVIRSKTKEICNELIYLRLTEDSFIEAMQQIAEQSTSTFPSIKPSDLYQCEIPCPLDDKLTILLENVFSIIAINQKENLGLSQLRDALLPKLMNGEIEIY